jgi:hypothetical protein
VFFSTMYTYSSLGKVHYSISCQPKLQRFSRNSTVVIGCKTFDACSAMPPKMMWLVEIIRQEVNAVVIPDIFPLLHRGY